jgi:hypothetical protein
LRPVDRMVAHTGYLVFARALLNVENEIENPIGLEENKDKLVDIEGVAQEEEV